MPNIGIHLLLTNQALRHWSASSAGAPFPLDDARAVSVFRHGAMLPDAGYFPRGDRLFSELAHLYRSGDLLGRLLEEAATPLERAHAWGWATHVLGDLAIHPLINQAHGEFIHGDRARIVTSSEDEVGHMRLEYGLDAAVFSAYPELERVGALAPPPIEVAEFVAGTFMRMHGWAPEPDHLASGYRMAGRMALLCRLVNRVHTARFRIRPLHAVARAAARAIAPPRRWMPRAWNSSSAAHAVLRPLTCPDWLLDEVGAVVATFGSRLDQLRDHGATCLGNYDLITGLHCAEHALTPRTEAVLAGLARRCEPMRIAG
jgi:hypothetical protein